MVFFSFIFFNLFPKDLLILVSSTAVAWEHVGVVCSALINVTENPSRVGYPMVFSLYFFKFVSKGFVDVRFL